MKRLSNNDGRSLSPPPAKRRTRLPPGSEQEANTKSLNNQMTIYSWNVNGVGPLLQRRISFDRKPTSLPLRDFLKRHAWPQFCCLQEVKINRDDRATQHKVDVAANAGNGPGEPTYTTHFSLPRDKYNATGFGGKVHGVATLVRDDWAKHIQVMRRPDWDLEGRVLIVELAQKMAVVNGYWPNGTDNPYKDPVTGIVTGTRHEHKLRFHRHMLDESLDLERRGFLVVLIGDVNVARSSLDGHPNLRTSPPQHVKNRYDFNQKFFDSPQGFQGIDVFRHLHGRKQKYTYHPRGVGWGSSCDRVDNIVVSRALFPSPDAHPGAGGRSSRPSSPHVVATDILDNPADRGHSDHVPLFVTISLDSPGDKVD